MLSSKTMAEAGCIFESSMEAFGCHLNWKELENVNAITLLREKDILTKDHWDFDKRPTYFTAVRNLQGFVAYKLSQHGEEEDPVQFFQEVLDKDPCNINALSNMLHIETENSMTVIAGEYKHRLLEIFRGKNYEHRARAFADRAHAIRYFEQDMRRFHYMEYIERACDIGKSCDTPHKAEWFFDLGLALYRRDVQMLYLRRLWSENGRSAKGNPQPHHCHFNNRRCDVTRLDLKIRAGFNKACNYFYDVVRISITDDIKSLSWVFLGILLNHDPDVRRLAGIFEDPNHELHNVGADECYQRGLKLGLNNPITLRRVGAEYVKLHRYEEARHLLVKSRTLLPSAWFSCRHSGLMYLGMYENPAPGTPPNREYLREAEQWFKQALKYKLIHADYSDLGYVYYLSGDYTKAITQYKLAAKNTQDDYFDLVKTHKSWAQCLGAQGELDGQRDQELKAERLRTELREPDEASIDDFFHDDFEFYSAPNKPGFVRILLGTHIWCTDSQRIAAELGRSQPPNGCNCESPDHGDGDHVGTGSCRDIQTQRYKYDVFVSYAERDRRWAFAFLHKLESEHGIRGCINHRDFVAGVEEVDNRLNAIQDSYKCVIVLSPSYCRDNTGQHGLEGQQDEYKG